MPSVLVLLHILAVGIWIGCIFVETAFEHSLPGSPPMRLAVAGLHVSVDLWVEIPAFLAVLATGLLMLPAAPDSPLLQAKIAIGLAAVALNIWCVRLVFRRRRLLVENRLEAAARVDDIQHKAGALLLLLIVVALGIGGWFAAG